MEALFSISVLWVSESILFKCFFTILLQKQLYTVKRQKQNIIIARIKEKKPTTAITTVRSMPWTFPIDNSVPCARFSVLNSLVLEQCGSKLLGFYSSQPGSEKTVRQINLHHHPLRLNDLFTYIRYIQNLPLFVKRALFRIVVSFRQAKYDYEIILHRPYFPVFCQLTSAYILIAQSRTIELRTVFVPQCSVKVLALQTTIDVPDG